MKHYAVTGNIGSGKSTVCSIFEILDVPVYYSDIRAKQLMLENENVRGELKILLGEDVYLPDGELNRKWMAHKIFNSPVLLKGVNDIVHPAVRKDYFKWRENQDSNYTLQESALTFEIGAEKHMDGVILVYAPEELLIYRTMQRSQTSEEEVRSRLEKQMSQELKKDKANYIINNGLGESLIKQIVDLDILLNKS